MKRTIFLTAFLFLCPIIARAEYSDHRGKNLDSLENAVVIYTPDKIKGATEDELKNLVRAYGDLMEGYKQINGGRSELFARKCVALAESRGWWNMRFFGHKVLGQLFWGREQYDSSLFYYQQAMEDVKMMERIAADPDNSQGYSQTTVDDNYSSLYGSIGNLYNMMDSIPKAMEYYKKAGEIFSKHGWNESNAILYYNMGETWREEKDFKQARQCYDTSLEYALASGDSLQISSAMKGMGNLWLDLGKTRKAFKCLKAADEYYSLHEDQEFKSRIETLDLIGQVLSEQKKQFRIITLGAIILALLSLSLLLVSRKAWIFRRQRDSADEIIDEVIDETMTGKYGETTGQSVEEDKPLLTDRETEILRMIASGMTSPQIADKVFLSLATIKWHRKKLLEKFDAANTAELISKAKEQGLV